MSAQKPLQLHQYAYDPLDRHVKTGAEDQATHLFYCRQRVATEITGDTRAQVFETEEAVLAYRTHQGEGLTTALVAGDAKRSTLSVLIHTQPASVAFTPYGHQPLTPGAHRVPGFNGERADPLTGHYLLGNGYRAFNPILMRFNSPDRWSPFGKGGINAYAYCAGEPVNRADPTGRTWAFIKRIGRFLGVMKRSRSSVESPSNIMDKAVDLNMALKRSLEDMEAALAHTKQDKLLMALKHEGELMDVQDQIEKLKAFNSTLLEQNQRLTQQLAQKSPPSRMPPPLPTRPNATLTHQSIPIPVTTRQVDYLDLAILKTAVRRL
ncbi:RHS repeat-associated core domain-containing protein [Pseudomonas helleri]|uniref:RHS repeat-associated core domain-containing protein n=1 Tax=Pseudomonas helleri TaxID=1608996 RepID=UPI003827234C